MIGRFNKKATPHKHNSMRVLFIKSVLDRSELDMVLKIHATGIYIRVLTSEKSKFMKELKAVKIVFPCKDISTKFNLAVIKQIRSLVKHEKFNILHTSQSSGLANAIWASYGKRLKIIGYRGTLAKIRRYDPTYWLAILNPKVDKVICVNRSIYNYMCNFYDPKDLLLNYKGYDVEWAKELPKEDIGIKEISKKAFVVMYIARTKNRPHKGLEVLIKAIHHLNDPRVHLVFIGSYDKSSLDIADNGMASNNIHLLGKLPNAAKYLNNAHLFILPSLRDGLPRVLKEAMAQEIPLVVTNIPGPSELVKNQITGLIVEPANHEAIANAINYYLTHEEERMLAGKRGKEYLEQNFSSQLFVQKTINLYEQIYQELNIKKN